MQINNRALEGSHASEGLQNFSFIKMQTIIHRMDKQQGPTV